MFVPEFLYQLSQRDQQQTWLDPRITRDTVSASLAQVSVGFTVPDDRVLVLTSATASAVPGGTQTINTITISLLVPNEALTSGLVRWLAAEAFVVNAQRFVNWSGATFVPPRWQVIARGIFSAGAVANEMNLVAHGVLIPVGNVQRV